MASLTACRIFSVVWYFMSAEITAGFSPRPTMAAVTDHPLATNHPVDRNEDVLAPVGPVRERARRGQMAAADVHAGMVGGDDGERNSDVLALAEQVIRIEQAEGETHQGRHGAQRDVALVPREPDAEGLPALVCAARHHADVAHVGRVRARGWPGQRKARDLLALCEPWQVVVLLLLGAILLDQLAGPQRIRDHDDDDDIGRARGDLAEDQRLRLRGKTEPAVLL